jgi:predicted nucleotidyltransferase
MVLAASTESGLPEAVERSLTGFVDAAKAAFAADLLSIVLFGSGAEQNLRATSDVNILVVLKRFDRSQADGLREPLRFAHAAIELNAMFVLETEVPLAMEAFAVKFSDILHRHRVLFGSDPFAAVRISNAALLRRLRQVLLNLQIRLRERYILMSLREEQLGRVIADAAPPLRASAASILQLQGSPAPSPKKALERLVAGLNDPALAAVLAAMTKVRGGERLEPGQGPATLIDLMRLTERLRAEVDRLGVDRLGVDRLRSPD